jgi:hypothetical protein
VGDIQFEGVGSPAEVRARQEAERAVRIEQVRKHKNRKARQAAQRTNSLLAGLGMSRKERRAIGQRQRAAKPKKPRNYQWVPNA